MTRRHVAGAIASAAAAWAAGPVRLGIAGLVHGHAHGLFRLAKGHPAVELVGISERDRPLVEQYRRQYGFTASMVHDSLEAMLDRVKPEAVMLFTDTFDHQKAVDICAERKIPVMMEKPLAISNEHGRRIAAAAKRSRIPILVNYETTWYASNPVVRQTTKNPAFGPLRKAVIRDGHAGPKEIGVDPEFLRWLTDPARNGGGALFDFGCYGANLMTWLMGNRRPNSVLAQTRQFKPDVYAQVDDDATILLDYGTAQATIEASWNWPFSRKDMELYGAHGSIKTVGRDGMRVRLAKETTEREERAPALPAPHQDYLVYFAAVVRGEARAEGLSSLENNLVVTEILDAARQSAATGRVVALPRSG